MKKSVKFFAVTLAAVMSLTPIVPIKNNVNATSGSIAISEKNFPDIRFRQYVETYIDSNEDGSLSQAEIDAVTEIDLWAFKYNYAHFTTKQVDVLDLTGIEYFADLEILIMNSSYGSTSLDLTKNKKLVEIRCNETPIESINIKGLKDLEVLVAYKTDLKSLDVSTNINLRALECQETYITKLDLRNNPALSGEYAGGSYSNHRALRADLDGDYDEFTRSTGIGAYYSYYGINKLETGNDYYYDFFSSVWNDGVQVQYCKAADLNSLLARTSGLKYVYYSGDGSTSISTLSNLAGVTFLYLFNVGSPTIYISDNSILKVAYQNDITDYPYADHHAYVNWEGEEYKSDIKGYMYLSLDANVITSSSAPAPITSTSDEPGVAGFVERLYSVALGRASDPNGKADWVNRVRSEGYTGADLARGFLYSDEFLGKSMSNSEFLDVLYATFFNRPADEGGKTNWLNLMNQGWSKKQVIDGFINSIEWANLCLTYGIASGTTAQPNITIAPSEDIINFATRLYTTCLGRDADPNGLNDWATQLANMKISGSDAAHGFFFSSEFLNAGHSDAEYVKRLYRTFMGREYDQGGFDNWMNLLASGASREEVFRGFAGSAEWAGICAEYGILK